MSGDRVASRVKGGQALVGTGRLGIEQDAYGRLGGEAYGEGRGYGWDSDGDGINRCENTVANVILGMEPIVTL